MHLIDKEKQFLLEIAQKDFAENNPKDYLRSSLEETETYYLDRDSDRGFSSLMEYEFQNPVELKNILEGQWTDPSVRKMIPAVMVAAFKLRDADSTTEQISEKIYNF